MLQLVTLGTSPSTRSSSEVSPPHFQPEGCEVESPREQKGGSSWGTGKKTKTKTNKQKYFTISLNCVTFKYFTISIVKSSNLGGVTVSNREQQYSYTLSIRLKYPVSNFQSIAWPFAVRQISHNIPLFKSPIA